jgi:hypothetical protein
LALYAAGFSIFMTGATAEANKIAAQRAQRI